MKITHTIRTAIRTWRCWLACALLVALGACLPIPRVELPLELPEVRYRSSPLTVQTEYLAVAGAPEPHTPAPLNQSYVLRYYRPEDTLEEGTLEEGTLETVLILVPGIFGGASTFDIVARQLVASTPGLEVWAWDRRANALEDRSAFVESLRRRDPMVAYRYYVTEALTPEGFTPTPPEALRFMGYWGLELHLEDLRSVVALARERAARVILGGHSLGGSLVGFYAAYRGEGAPGFHDLDGLLLLDGVLGRTGGYALDPALATRLPQLPDVEGLESGEDAPYLTFGPAAPLAQARREAAAVLARFDPEGLSPGGFVPFPATNAAVLGILESERYAPALVFGSSVGHAVGAVFGGNLIAFILGGAQSASSRSVIGVADGYEAVGWAADEESYTDLGALARSWSLVTTNRNEWYFPLRLALDIGLRDMRLADDPGFVPNATVTTPTLIIGAERGLITSLDDLSAYQNARPGSLFASYIVPGFTHNDILQATDNPVVPLFKIWLERLPARSTGQ